MTMNRTCNGASLNGKGEADMEKRQDNPTYPEYVADSEDRGMSDEPGERLEFRYYLIRVEVEVDDEGPLSTEWTRLYRIEEALRDQAGYGNVKGPKKTTEWFRVQFK